MEVTEYQVHLLLSGLVDAFGVRRLETDTRLVSVIANQLCLGLDTTKDLFVAATELAQLERPQINFINEA